MKTIILTLFARVALLAVLVTVLPLGAAGAPLLLAKYRFDGDANDATGRSPPGELYNTAFVSNTLFMPANPTNWYQAEARIAGLSYTSFTVAVDFKPTGPAPSWGQAILYGGPLDRWIGFDNVDGHLRLTLNNHSLQYDFADAVLETNQWHTLVCSVDIAAQRVIIFLHSAHLPNIHLQNFQFNVIGTDYEQWGNVFGFVNHGNASAFCGYADNLRVYSRPLTAAEIAALVPPRLNLVQADNTLLVHGSVDWSGYVLQTRQKLPTTNVWTTVTNRPVVVGNQYVVVQPLTNVKRFYRLMKP
jgi:hypothetical protein